jgi:hypothetical protein
MKPPNPARFILKYLRWVDDESPALGMDRRSGSLQPEQGMFRVAEKARRSHEPGPKYTAQRDLAEGKAGKLPYFLATEGMSLNHISP